MAVDVVGVYDVIGSGTRPVRRSAANYTLLDAIDFDGYGCIAAALLLLPKLCLLLPSMFALLELLLL